MGPSCAVAWRAITDDAGLIGPEPEAIRRAIPARRAEFAAGRAAAREALARAGHPPTPIAMGPDRAPVWPEGIVGSITHAQGMALAAVARASAVLCLGIDMEPDAPMPAEVIDTIRAPGEAPADPRTARAVFCAKEAVYKAVYPLTGAVWGFDAVRIDLWPDEGAFDARLDRDAGGIWAGSVLRGHLVRGDGLILTGLIVARS